MYIIIYFEFCVDYIMFTTQKLIIYRFPSMVECSQEKQFIKKKKTKTEVIKLQVWAKEKLKNSAFDLQYVFGSETKSNTRSYKGK